MKLNPCKICGAKPILKKTALLVGLRWYQCPNHKQNMTTMEYNLEMARECWNRKNPLKAQEEKA